MSELVPPTLKRREMMPIIDKWMNEHEYGIKTWPTLVELEGGSGRNRIRTIKEAKAKPTTFPGRWFNSRQRDMSFYSAPHYVYSLYWAATRTSGGAYKAIGRLCEGKPVADVGGSIFTALVLLRMGVKNVELYNFEDSPQTQFAQYIIDKYSLPITLEYDPDSILSRNRIGIMKAYLEHFKNVDEEIDRWCAPLSGFDELYISNSFCEIAYGHYIPITVNGKVCKTKKIANNEFIKLMEKRGYSREKVKYFNSKTSKYTFIKEEEAHDPVEQLLTSTD